MGLNVKNNIFFELKVIKEYWQIASITATVIFFGVYFYLQNTEANQRLKELTKTNEELKDRISRLEGQIDVINSNMILFVERNPGLTSYRLETLEEAMDVQQILNSLNRKNETEIKIIQIPAPFTNQQTAVPVSIPIIETESKNVAQSKKKSLLKKK